MLRIVPVLKVGIVLKMYPLRIRFNPSITIPLNHLVHLLVGKISKRLHLWGAGQEGVARKDLILDDTLRLAQSIFAPYNL
jgi:hypothetical protein